MKLINMALVPGADHDQVVGSRVNCVKKLSGPCAQDKYCAGGNKSLLHGCTALWVVGPINCELW